MVMDKGNDSCMFFSKILPRWEPVFILPLGYRQSPRGLHAVKERRSVLTSVIKIKATKCGL